MARYYVLDRDFLNLGGMDCAPKVDDIDESSLVHLTRNNIGDFNGESVYRISQRNVELCGVVTSDGAVARVGLWQGEHLTRRQINSIDSRPQAG